MTGLLTTARIACKSPEARDTTIAAFRDIIAYTIPNEPDVLQYICAVPLDDASKTEIYMIEEYASQSASTAHLATPPVQSLLTLFTTGDVLAQPPSVHTSRVHKTLTSNPPLPLTSTPAIMLVNVGYRPGTTAHALLGWAAVADEAMSDIPGFNVITIAEDEGGSSVRVVYVLDGWEAWEAFHASGAGERNRAHNGGDRDGVAEAVRVRGVEGFVGRANI